MHLFTARKCFFYVFLIVVLAMLSALYFQLVMHYPPCVLCVMQRIAIICVGVIALVAWLHGPKSWGVKIYGVLAFIFAVLGIWFAGRQVWLHFLPADQVPACGPGFNYLVHNLPPQDFLVTLFKGTGECAVIHWSFLGVTIPGWSLMCFVLLAVISGWQVVRKGSKQDV